MCSEYGGQPNLNDMWIVNGLIFPLTYDLRSFPNIFPKNQLKLGDKQSQKPSPLS